MQVVDTCVRNGYYEEALDLCSHVRHMERKHTHIPIVKVLTIIHCVHKNGRRPSSVLMLEHFVFC